MPDAVSRRRALVAAAVLWAGEVTRARAAEADGALYGRGLLVQLQVRDLERSIRFYTEVLGFRVTERRDDLQFVHLECGIQGLQIGLSGGGEKPPAPGSVVLNFSVKGDLEAERARLERRGVVFSGPTQVIPGKVRLAGFSDPDGYRLRLAGRDATPSSAR